MTFLQLYLIGAAVALGMMVALWLVSLALRNSSLVDIFWGTGFVIANWVYFALAPDGLPARKWLIGVLVTLWACGSPSTSCGATGASRKTFAIRRGGTRIRASGGGRASFRCFCCRVCYCGSFLRRCWPPSFTPRH